MNPRLRAAIQGLVWFAAANFAALAVLLLVLAVTGAVEMGRWKGALGVLRGTSEALANKDVARLRKAEQAEAERGERPGDLKIAESWERLQQGRTELEERKAQEREALMSLAQAVEREFEKIRKARDEWNAARVKAEQDRLRHEEELRSAASEKVRRIYRHMRPEAVAADLSRRTATEAGAIVNAMSDRSAAEVLEAMADPARRVEIYEAMAGEGRQ